MPPSGFRKKGVKGLLSFVKGVYLFVIDKYSDWDLSKQTDFEHMKNDFDELTSRSLDSMTLNLPKEAVEGLRIFLLDNFDYMFDLMKENLTENYGPKLEVKDIDNYLKGLESELRSFSLGSFSSIPEDKIPESIRN